ncbi:MAG: GumC family protein [Vicinamibacterales bacterium]
MAEESQVKAQRPSPRGENGATPTSDSLMPLHWHLLDYVRVLSKRRWTALPVFLLVVGYAAFTMLTAVPEYEARVQLLIEAENPNVLTFKEVIEQDRASNQYYETQYTILHSRALAKKALEKLDMWDHPQFAGTLPTPFSLVSTLTNWVASAINAAQRLVAPERAGPAQPEQPGAGETAAQARAIDAFLGSLSVNPVRNSQLIDLSFRSPDPPLTALAANALAQAYIEQNLEFKFMASKEASDWLGQKLTEQGKQVEASENELQKYREQTDAVVIGDRDNIVTQKLGDLNAAVTRAKTERIGKETLYNQLRSIEKDERALDTFPAIQANGFIQQLKSQLADLERQKAQLSERLADRHPEMIKLQSAMETAESKLRAETGKVVQAIRNEYLAAQEQERSLMAALDAQKREALSQNRTAIKYEALERVATSNRQIFESLLQRAKETGISGELRTSNVRVVDAADTPTVPVGPRRARNMLFALFAGSILAVGLAFFVEYLDNRIKSSEEIKAWGLPCLGLIPASASRGFFEDLLRGGKDSGSSTPLLTNGVPPHFGESFRALRTQLLFSSPEETGGSLVVTSTGPHEGKTCVASNLAISLAQASRGVLLIDADMRQPRVHKVFNQPLAPGLSNVIQEGTQPSGVVRQTEVPSLWLLSAGDLPSNPAELLASRRFKDLLSSAMQRFDWVVIDTPPVMAVTDACVVAHVASAVLFVVGSEMTSRHTAAAALEQLSAVNSKFVGAVLNMVKLDRNRYYYSHYYHRKYRDYYERLAPS